MTDQPPQLVVGAQFMALKGYEDAHPIRMVRVRDRFRWYLTYDVVDGVVELQVDFDPVAREWSRRVVGFRAVGR